MIQVTEPTRTTTSRNAWVLMRSMTAPETMDAVVHENSRKAAQKTPLMRAQNMVSSGVRLPAWTVTAPPIWGPMSSDHGTAKGASLNPPISGK